MEWVNNEYGYISLCCGGLRLSVHKYLLTQEWNYSVYTNDSLIYRGSTDTEERAKRFAIYEAHRIIRDLVNDLAEITGENYHLELN